MSDWTWVRRERVRWRDCDAMGHVNNAVYSTFLEEARIEALGGLAEFILARVEIDFRSELRAAEEIEVRTRCSRIGTKSLDLEHEIHATGARRAGEERARRLRLRAGASVELSDEIRERVSGTPASA